jgi:hypothetical protein
MQKLIVHEHFVVDDVLDDVLMQLMVKQLMLTVSDSVQHVESAMSDDDIRVYFVAQQYNKNVVDCEIVRQTT